MTPLHMALTIYGAAHAAAVIVRLIVWIDTPHQK